MKLSLLSPLYTFDQLYLYAFIGLEVSKKIMNMTVLIDDNI